MTCEEKRERLKKIRCFVLDMDGTIYLGNRLFPFTPAFLQAVEKSGREFCYFTNNKRRCLSAKAHFHGHSHHTGKNAHFQRRNH